MRYMTIPMASALRHGGHELQVTWAHLTSAADRGLADRVQDLLSRLAAWGQQYGDAPADRIGVVGIEEALDATTSGQGRALVQGWFDAYDHYTPKARWLASATGPDLLSHVAAIIHGQHWQPRIAADLAVREDSVRKWLIQDTVPRGVMAELYRHPHYLAAMTGEDMPPADGVPA